MSGDLTARSSRGPSLGSAGRAGLGGWLHRAVRTCSVLNLLGAPGRGWGGARLITCLLRPTKK